MEKQSITMEEIDLEHRRERARDRERLLRGEITPQALQEENSIIPMSAEVRLVDFAASLERFYGNR